MAADAQTNTTAEDLSMEEILHSIRKIIADEEQVDGNTTGAETLPDAPAPHALSDEGPEGAMGSQVLELTDMVEAPMESLDVLKEIDDALDDAASGSQLLELAEESTIQDAPAVQEPSVFDAAETTAPAEAAAPASPEHSKRLLSDSAAHSSAASLKKVIETHKATTPMPYFRNGETIEDLVLETLKPLLKEWLDANLPTMVERLVEREIRKLVD